MHLQDPSATTARRRRRILLIEDEQAIADTLIYALRSEGFAIEHHLLGHDGLAAARAGRADLLVLDVGLPDINGFDLCRELRRESQLPVIFLTARADEIDRVIGLEIGADDYVVKPFSPRELTARVRSVLRRAQSNAPAAAPGPCGDGPFQVDQQTQRVHYWGQALELTRYEHLLLRTLLEHPGRVFSRAQLMQRVWTAPEHSLERTVDTHVKTLRAKLRVIHPGSDPITTHRGLGYSIEPRR